MAEAPSTYEFYQLYIATAEKVSDRRGAANQWLLSVNSALVSLYGFIAAGKSEVDDPEKAIWQWAIPLAGIIVCFAWAALLASYRKLNAAKFKVIHEIEKGLPHQLFEKEQIYYKAEKKNPLSSIETAIPWSFAGLFLVILIAVVIT